MLGRERLYAPGDDTALCVHGHRQLNRCRADIGGAQHRWINRERVGPNDDGVRHWRLRERELRRAGQGARKETTYEMRPRVHGDAGFELDDVRRLTPKFSC